MDRRPSIPLSDADLEREGTDPKLVKLLLDRGGDQRRDGHTFFTDPLIRRGRVAYPLELASLASLLLLRCVP